MSIKPCVLSLPVLGAVAIAGSLSQPLFASDGDLLRVLQQKGYLTSAEVSEIESARTEQAEKEKAAAVVIAPAGKNVLNLKIGGRFQFQYDGISAETKTGGVTTSLTGTNKADFRRLFLTVSADLKNNWYLNGTFDFARNASSNGGLVDAAFIGWKPEKELDFHLGYEKVPFGLETTTSSSSLLAIENAPTANYFTSVLRFNERHAGASVGGKLDEGLSYRVMIANGGQGFNASGNGYSVWGRVRYENKFDDIKFMVGADVGYQNENPNLNSASVFGYNLYGRVEYQDLLVQGEFIGTSVEGTSTTDRSSPYGGVVTVAYKIDQFQPVFQYSYLDSTNFSGGINPSSIIRSAPTSGALGSIAGPHRMSVYYLGVNYYIMGNDVKLSVGGLYASADANNGSDGNGTSYEAIGGRAQLQIQF